MELTTSDVWTLASTALVLIMTPGLALFYGGLVRVRSVVNMMLFSVSAMGVVGVLWVLFGYSMNYFADGESGFAGSPFKDFGLLHTAPADFIGVVRDYNFLSLREKTGPMMFTNFHDYNPLQYFVRIAPGDPKKALESIRAAWSKAESELPLSYVFLDENIQRHQSKR